MEHLQVGAGHYAYELEALVRAVWTGAPLIDVPIRTHYGRGDAYRSHFKAGRDMWHISVLNASLVLEAWLLPLSLRRERALGAFKGKRATRVAKDVLIHLFTEHNETPFKVGCAAGLGLFFGIFPIWGYQMVACAVVAHRMHLNKSLAMTLSNVSMPPMMPFVLYGSLALGHWLITGNHVDLSWDVLTSGAIGTYMWHWLVGSCVLAVTAALAGGILAWGIACLWRAK
jgi:uncharacterized protein (DUF2062 family)